MLSTDGTRPTQGFFAYDNSAAVANGYRFRSGADTNGRVSTYWADAPDFSLNRREHSELPALQAGGGIGGGGSGGEPGTAANTGTSTFTLGPTTSVPGSIGKTASELTTTPDQTKRGFATNDGGFVYTNENGRATKRS